ncbi:type II toxin-antitoxin system VapC family toxin [Iningainema tapete]|uniref:Type II toxin-antitoxin system VapC family toxin n=1 Tax=Iningainema tapete BLCC-T55 TaxID=2748662 RepID=A0A8J7BW46_9CYAN|nr:type II toxin-antitoxin system VapC family toxin [Iningainema tapete]MBD2771107.1 type II toxin-antitoxin system VapC family toxin [Iningainema tapete BLCC-T55]
MYLLDTNHCSYIINNTPNVIAALQSRSGSDIGVSIITYGELLYMTEKSERVAQNLAAVQAFLKGKNYSRESGFTGSKSVDKVL